MFGLRKPLNEMTPAERCDWARRKAKRRSVRRAALQEGVKNGYSDMVAVLLDKYRFDLTETGDGDREAAKELFWEAARSRNMEIWQHLSVTLEAGNRASDLYYPMISYLIAESWHEGIDYFFKTKTADQSGLFESAVYQAARLEQPDMLSYVLTFSSKFKVVQPALDAALNFACEANRMDHATLLLSHGADTSSDATASFVSALLNENQPLLDILISYTKDLGVIGSAALTRARQKKSICPLIPSFEEKVAAAQKAQAPQNAEAEAVFKSAEVTEEKKSFTLTTIFNYTLAQQMIVTRDKSSGFASTVVTPFENLPQAALDFARAAFTAKYGAEAVPACLSIPKNKFVIS